MHSILGGSKAVNSLIARSLLLFLPILIVPEIWGVFRMRNVQEALANAMGINYTDNQWTFGQIVAVVIFAPVIVEAVYSSRPL